MNLIKNELGGWIFEIAGRMKLLNGLDPAHKPKVADPCSTQQLAEGAGIVKNLQWSTKQISELIVTIDYYTITKHTGSSL